MIHRAPEPKASYICHLLGTTLRGVLVTFLGAGTKCLTDTCNFKEERVILARGHSPQLASSKAKMAGQQSPAEDSSSHPGSQEGREGRAQRGRRTIPGQAPVTHLLRPAPVSVDW